MDAEAAAEKQRQAAQGQVERLKELLSAAHRHPDLSQQHLYWTAVVEALAGKPFTLVDPKLEGRRQLILGDPGGWKWGMPVVEPSDGPRPVDKSRPERAVD